MEMDCKQSFQDVMRQMLEFCSKNNTDTVEASIECGDDVLDIELTFSTRKRNSTI